MNSILMGIKFLFKSKWKIGLGSSMTVFFTLVFFPYGDLADLVSTQVALATNNTVYLQFDDMELEFLPTPGVSLKNVYLESPYTKTLEVNSLEVHPSIMSVIRQDPLGSVKLIGFLGGDTKLKVGTGDKTENGVTKKSLNLQVENLDLQKLGKLINSPVAFKGLIETEAKGQADITFGEQPEIDISINVKNFELPPASIETPMGPMTLPDFKLKSATIKGRLVNGTLIIEEGKIGEPKDDLKGDFKGQMAIKLQPPKGPLLGAYDFQVDMTTSKSFSERASLFLTLLDSYKTSQGNEDQFKFKISATAVGLPPKFSR